MENLNKIDLGIHSNFHFVQVNIVFVEIEDAQLPQSGADRRPARQVFSSTVKAPRGRTHIDLTSFPDDHSARQGGAFGQRLAALREHLKKPGRARDGKRHVLRFD
jgi:hypothetical protein